MDGDDVELAYKKAKSKRRLRCLAPIAAVILAFIIGIIIGYFARGSRSPEKATASKRSSPEARAELQSQFRDILKEEEIRKNLRFFSKRPHIAGSKRQEELAQELAKRWRGYGFDKVEMPEYEVLLSFPQKDKPNMVTLLYSNGNKAYQTKTTEQIVEKSENDTLVIPPFLGYAPEGTVEGELVYVNYGQVEDFKELTHKLGVNITGKIAIMRYGKIYRGDQVANAAEYGALGAIIYSDPADYALEGYGSSETYPNTRWLPSTGVQRGSIYTGQGIGDPRTPGLPSIPGVYTLPNSKSGLPKIPAHPMSYGDAVNFLSKMAGPAVPDEWKGNLNITYRLGPGLINNMRVKLEVHNKLEAKKIFNVIGTIYGKEEPDRYVLMGNHRDSWVFGAVDASSGTSVTTEIARGLGELLKNDWRPRRTIKMCSWGGEEFSLIGSREWVEEHYKALTTKAVTYLNMDIAVDGNFVMQASGSPILRGAIMSQLKKIMDPNAHNGKTTMYDIMVERQPSKDAPGKPKYKMVGAGSDYAPFYHFAGVPVADFSYGMGYKNKTLFYPVYHSQHDTFNWMVKFADPDFLFHKAMSQFGGSLLLSIADTPLLPLTIADYASKLNKSFTTMKLKDTFGKQNISLEYLGNAVEKFVDAAKEFLGVVAKVQETSDEKGFPLLRRLNDQMVQVEKSFIYPYGLPGRQYVRHVLFAPELHNTYGSSSFPGIADAMYDANTTGRWDSVRRQVSIALECVLSATEAIQPYKADNKNA